LRAESYRGADLNHHVVYLCDLEAGLLDGDVIFVWREIGEKKMARGVGLLLGADT
jgi:hypothetical protein